MAVIDASLVFLKTIDTAATVTSETLDLGKNGVNTNPLYIDVKLSQGVTGGSVTSVKVQSSADEGFSAPIDEMTITVGKTAAEQKRPCTIAQAFCPIHPGGRYVRLVVAGNSPAGGKLWAYISPDIQVPVL